MQAAGNFVGIAVELAAGMKLCHHYFRGGTFQFVVGMNIGRDAAAVINHADGIIGVYGDGDFVAITSQRFVNRIVYDLKHHVMQSRTIAGVTDIHAGAFTYRLQTFKHFDAGRVIFARVFQIFVVFVLCHFVCVDFLLVLLWWVLGLNTKQ